MNPKSQETSDSTLQPHGYVSLLPELAMLSTFKKNQQQYFFLIRVWDVNIEITAFALQDDVVYLSKDCR